MDGHVVTTELRDPRCETVRPRKIRSSPSRTNCWTTVGLARYKVYWFFCVNVANAWTSLMERVVFHKPPWLPEFEVFSTPARMRRYSHTIPRQLSQWTRVLKDSLSFCRCRRPPLLPRSMANMYTGAKRDAYLRAADDLERTPNYRVSGFIKAFVKRELIQIPWEGTCEKRVVPRMIQPRDIHYNLRLGCYLKHLEHPIYAAIRHAASELGYSAVVTKGLNSPETASEILSAWGLFGDPVCVGLDASKFDQHISEPMLRWEHSIYASLYHGLAKSDLKKLLAEQLRNKGVVDARDGRVRLDLPASRCSGDMNTALGNCLITTAVVITYLLQHGLHAAIIDNGDDCLLIMERRSLPGLSRLVREFWVNYGIVLKVEDPVDRVEEIELCQAHPVRTVHGWSMQRALPSTLSKDLMVLHPHVTPRNIRGYWGTIGQAGLALASGVPVYQSFYKMLIRSSNGELLRGHLEESGFFMMSKGLTSHSAEISAAARASLHAALGISPDHQRAMEALYDTQLLSTEVTTARPSVAYQF